MRDQARAAIARTRPRAAPSRTDDAFGDHLADQSTVRRRARREWPFPFGGHGPRQQEIREIRADDQHDDATAQASTNSAGRRRPLTCSSSGTILGRMSLRWGYSTVSRLPSASSRPALSYGRARFQSADDRDGVAPAVGFRGEREGKVEIDARAWREDCGNRRKRVGHRRR